MKFTLIQNSLLGLSLLCAPTALSHAQPKRGDVLFQSNFEAPAALQEWRGIQPGRVTLEPGFNSTHALAVNSPEDGPKDVKVQVPLPLQNLAGARIRVSMMVKAQDVIKPTHDYQGVKAMLHFKTPAGDFRPQPNKGQGTFDWKPWTFVWAIPASVTSMNLVLGVEGTTGKAWFDNIKVEVYSPPLVRPAIPPTGAPYKGHNLPRLRGAMVSNNVTVEHLEALAKWNVNLIRYQLAWRDASGKVAPNIQDREDYNVWLQQALARVDTWLPVCERLGIMVVLDLHTPPGGVRTDKKWRLFLDKRYQDDLVEVWKTIAQRYKRRKIIWGYDLVNEPHPDPANLPFEKGVMDWRDLATVVSRAIRVIDPDVPIIVEGEAGGSVSGLTYFEPIPVSGIVYSVHFYRPGAFTHQGLPGHPPLGAVYPGPAEGREWNKEELRREMAQAIQWSKDFNQHIYVGEFSAIRWAPGAARYISDCIELFEELGWDWTYHAFRESKVWSVEIGADKDVEIPSPTPTDRETVLRAWFNKNEKVRVSP